MTLPQTPWTISKEDIEAAMKMPPILASFYDQVVKAEARYLDAGIRKALGLWVSELEPELMYHVSKTRPFGLTAKGHGTPYIRFEWDENFYLSGQPETYPIRFR